MNSPKEVTGPINLGNPNEMTVRELADLVIGKTGTNQAVEYLELPSDDPRQRQPDITRARDQLGWEPRVPLDQGLDKTIAYFRDLGVTEQSGTA
jgi:UDP-glucuronate decarboxylase